MNPVPLEALSLVHTWQQKQSRVSGIILSHDCGIVIKLTGRVSVCDSAITLAVTDGCEMRLIPIESLTFTYADALLEIRGSGWRCILYDAKELNAGTKSAPNSEFETSD